MRYCNCERPIPVNETALQLGWRCIKCGWYLAAATVGRLAAL